MVVAFEKVGSISILALEFSIQSSAVLSGEPDLNYCYQNINCTFNFREDFDSRVAHHISATQK